MTVLQRNEAGFDLKGLARIVASATAAAVIAAGVVMAVTNEVPSPSTPEAQAVAASADVLHLQYQDRYFAELDELNKADIGVVGISTTKPFLAGTGTQTHKGRVSPVENTATQPGATTDKADQLHYQQAAELTDPADFKFKN
ncbi:MAG: hypothetical protein DWQ40_08035 [Actinobacteria bacterium]|nr:MAG: hypothetical protein DWQ40_08035 [Actinomycetota bacterium]REK40243.1 MAG: hypothetical protein DWQ20_02320 [Actinomycetota bacterium]